MSELTPHIPRAVHQGKAGGKVPISQETIKAILHDYYELKEGATTVARKYGVDKKSVYNMLVVYGKGTRPKGNQKGDTYHQPTSVVEHMTPTGGQRGRRT